MKTLTQEEVQDVSGGDAIEQAGEAVGYVVGYAAHAVVNGVEDAYDWVKSKL